MIYDIERVRTSNYYCKEMSRQRNVCQLIGEFLLHLPFKEKDCFLLWAGVCAVLWRIWGERNNSVLWCGEGPWGGLVLARFHVSL